MEHKKTFIEVGPGNFPELHLYNRFVSEDFAKAIAQGDRYIAIDVSSRALSHVEQGAVMRASLQDLAMSTDFDGEVDVIFIANVFGEPNAAVGLQNPFWLEKILNKFARMLKPKIGTLVIVESYTPSVARTLATYAFEVFGLTANSAYTPDAIRKELITAGFSESYVRNILLGFESEPSEHTPFVIVAKKA